LVEAVQISKKPGRSLKNHYRDYLQFAINTAYEAGRLTLGYFQSEIQPDFKTDDTPVTVADRKAEELIRSRIEKRYPSHSIVGEEFGTKENSETSYRWFVDPIDGTKSFVRGVPLYAVLMGLEIEDSIEVGVVFFPALNEMVYAASGEGCYWNGRRVQVSKIGRLDRSIVSFTDASGFEKYGRKNEWERIKRATYYGVGWSDAYGHALVATGRIELMLDPVMEAWDCGPFPVIMREAGGYFGDWSGKETVYGGEALSTTQKLLPEVLKIITG
jgi:myo-inositol-1(or 4)-monophosphatase